MLSMIRSFFVYGNLIKFHYKIYKATRIRPFTFLIILLLITTINRWKVILLYSITSIFFFILLYPLQGATEWVYLAKSGWKLWTSRGVVVVYSTNFRNIKHVFKFFEKNWDVLFHICAFTYFIFILTLKILIWKFKGLTYIINNIITKLSYLK